MCETSFNYMIRGLCKRPGLKRYFSAHFDLQTMEDIHLRRRWFKDLEYQIIVSLLSTGGKHYGI